MPFDYENTKLNGVKFIIPRLFHDERGFFLESFKSSDMKNMGIDEDFVQDNISCSKKNTVRGLHFQTGEFAQGKLVSVLKGKILDVVVDIIPDSQNFGEYIAVELDSQKREMLYIPPGYAHGFRAIEDHTLVLYKCTQEYSKGNEGGIFWRDPDLDIDWGITEEQAIVSAKDEELSLLKAIEN